jgi:hypothetical protein
MFLSARFLRPRAPENALRPGPVGGHDARYGRGPVRRRDAGVLPAGRGGRAACHVRRRAAGVRADPGDRAPVPAAATCRDRRHWGRAGAVRGLACRARLSRGASTASTPASARSKLRASPTAVSMAPSGAAAACNSCTCSGMTSRWGGITPVRSSGPIAASMSGTRSYSRSRSTPSYRAAQRDIAAPNTGPPGRTMRRASRRACTRSARRGRWYSGPSRPFEEDLASYAHAKSPLSAKSSRSRRLAEGMERCFADRRLWVGGRGG